MEPVDGQDTVVQGAAETLHRTIKVAKKGNKLAMTKLNVDHQLKDDDERLILLLKEQAENFSEDLVEKTLSKI